MSDLLPIHKGSAMRETLRLFVYGSLQPGAWNHRLIERYVRQAVPGTTRGILVDLGSYPAIVPGDGLVRGVLLTVDCTDALAITDRLEGHPVHYTRKETTVTLDDGRTATAWTYEYADAGRLADRPKLLVGYDDGVPVYAWSPPD